MYDERIMKLMKAFIENPSAEKIVEMLDTIWRICIIEGHINRPLYRVCSECVFDPICRIQKADPDIITDEEISTALLDAMKIVEMDGAENA